MEVGLILFGLIFHNASLEILSVYPLLFNPAVFQEFIKMTNHDIAHAINKRMSGDVRDAFLAIGEYSLGCV